ncbi:uncharacterized protein LOC142616362 [Castanea sativa]|uniref:uncharacterized protein LOC142616362 n=1 Tax=Castanea sativa TaxID=21020 RepID=UPI003F64BD0A
MLTPPEPSEDLFMYLSVSEHAVSVVLLRDIGVQQPVYYVSKTLVDVETTYLPLEKLVLALVHATRKLPHYFQAHTVYVLTEYPLQSLLKRSDFMGRIAKLGIWLGSFDIRYRPRNGASNVTRAGAKIVIITSEGKRLEHSLRLGFRASNNEAKYEALIARLKAVRYMGAQEVEIYLDSRLVVSQVQGSFKAWDLE